MNQSEMKHPSDRLIREWLYRQEMVADQLAGDAVLLNEQGDEALAAELESYNGMAHEFSARYRHWERRFVKQYGRGKRTGTAAHKQPARLWKAVLVAILIFILLVLIAVAAVYTVLRITYHDDHADIDLPFGAVTQTAEIVFSPPDGFTLDKSQNTPDNMSYQYTDGDGGFIDILVMYGYNQQGIDTEQAETEKIRIGNSEAFVSEKNGRVTLIAFHLGHSIKIFTSLNREEAIRLIETATLK